MDLIRYLWDQQEFSFTTFGPPRDNTAGIIDHIKKELGEIEKAPDDLEEWIDVVILAFDGALRIGAKPWEITEMLLYKLEKNKNRKWPDWRMVEPGKAIEHIKDADS